jgi:hypothetical protein
MPWFLLVDGAPPSPKGRDLVELCSMPRPADFFAQLFATLCATTALPAHIIEEQTVPREERVATGFCGTAEVGYRFVESECLATTVVPFDIMVETYGLPGMQVRWHYCFDYAGQAGHAAFRHIELQARFDDPAAESAFADVWLSVFQTVLLWAAAPESEVR